jgi:hypothetical protein
MFNIKEAQRDVVKLLANEYSEEEVLSIFSKHNFEDMTESQYQDSKLLLKRIRFRGIKLEGTQQSEFTYDRNIFSGVNVWTGGNFIGKSTIFKLIKYCITGRDSLKPDVKKWLKEAMLEYELNNNTFTMRIDFSSKRVQGDLVRTTIEHILIGNDVIDCNEFSYNNRTEMEEKLQEFFMSNLGLYSLKWTQKNSSKDSIRLEESSTSWATYYKAIFLESDEYHTLLMSSEKAYGNQAQKIIAIFLGLGLLKIQNRINVRLDKIRYELASTNESNKNETNAATNLMDSLEKEYKQVLVERNQVEFELKQFLSQSRLNEIMIELGKESKGLSQANQRKLSKENQLSQINRVIDEEQSAEIGLKEALHFKRFFNGIKVNSCPHCETQISEEKLRKEKENHICSVCEEPLTEGTQEQQAYLQTQIEENRQTLIRLKSEKRTVESDLSKAKADIEVFNLSTSKLKLELDKLNQVNINDLNKRLGSLILQQGKFEGKLEDLRERQKPIENQKNKDLILEKDVLASLISILEVSAGNQNEMLLIKFKESIKLWAINFGIKNVDDVCINTLLEPEIAQGGEATSFKDLTDGEKLRLKIAFFIQLMLLSKHTVGRHPKLLIIDSPGSSELIDKDFDEIISTFNMINKDHSEEIQILIASARDSILNATDSYKIEVRKGGETMF